MPTYVGLINWTDQGVRSVRETTDRAQAFEQLARNLGGEAREIFWTIGPYDLVTIFEAPDDETATAIALAVGSQGNVRTTTLRAFNADEIQGVIGKIPS